MAAGSGRSTEPPDPREATPVAVGTGVWALLLVIGLVIRHDLADSGREWWVWTAAAGTILGVIGLPDHAAAVRPAAGRLAAHPRPVLIAEHLGLSRRSDRS